ncbi:MAG: CRISPR-associated endonuclease Cas2 [Deltaproteobacteria bacterium]|nr:CRISPR-associated endonuclease Cas2 [Deltaproteobacteria bacterium]
MRSMYIVSYDISDPKRLRQVFKAMQGMGDHVQLSVFRCELSARDKVRMMAKLTKLIHHKEDQILIIDIGLAPGRSDQAVEAIGRSYAVKERTAIVV